MSDKVKRKKLDVIYSEVNYKKNYNLSDNNVSILDNIDTELKDYVIQEIFRCIHDFAYFVKEYIGYDMSNEQFSIFDTCHAFNHVGIKLEESMGKTHGIMFYLLHKICFTSNEKMAYLSNTLLESKLFLSKVKYLFERIPKWLKPSVEGWYKDNIHLQNGTTLYTGAYFVDSCKGHAISTLIMEDIDKVDENCFEETMRCLYPVVTSNPKLQYIYTYTNNTNKNNEFINKGCLLHMDDKDWIVYEGE